MELIKALILEKKATDRQAVPGLLGGEEPRAPDQGLFLDTPPLPGPLERPTHWGQHLDRGRS